MVKSNHCVCVCLRIVSIWKWIMTACSKFMVNSLEFACMCEYLLLILLYFFFLLIVILFYCSLHSTFAYTHKYSTHTHTHIHKFPPFTLCMRRYLLLLPLKLLFIIDNLSFIRLSKTFKVYGIQWCVCIREFWACLVDSNASNWSTTRFYFKKNRRQSLNTKLLNNEIRLF